MKSQFYCKSDSNYINFEKEEEKRFIKGKFYDGVVNNSLTNRIYIKNELGILEHITKAEMNAIFEMDQIKLREIKINLIIDGY